MFKAVNSSGTLGRASENKADDWFIFEQPVPYASPLSLSQLPAVRVKEGFPPFEGKVCENIGSGERLAVPPHPWPLPARARGN